MSRTSAFMPARRSRGGDDDGGGSGALDGRSDLDAPLRSAPATPTADARFLDPADDVLEDGGLLGDLFGQRFGRSVSKGGGKSFRSLLDEGEDDGVELLKEGKGAEDGVARMRLSEAASDEERPDDGAYRSTLDDPFTLNAAKQQLRSALGSERGGRDRPVPRPAWNDDVLVEAPGRRPGRLSGATRAAAGRSLYDLDSDEEGYNSHETSGAEEEGAAPTRRPNRREQPRKSALPKAAKGTGVLASRAAAGPVRRANGGSSEGGGASSAYAIAAAAARRITAGEYSDDSDGEGDVVGALAAASSGRLSLAPRYEPRAANGEAELRAKLEAMGRDELLALAATLLSQVAQATALHAKGH